MLILFSQDEWPTYFDVKEFTKWSAKDDFLVVVVVVVGDLLMEKRELPDTHYKTDMTTAFK